MVESSKRERLADELRARQTYRRYAMQDLYAPARAREESDLKQASFPPREDWLKLLSIRNIWESDDTTTSLQEKLDEKTEVIRQEISLWQHAGKLGFFKFLVDALDAVGFPIPLALRERLDRTRSRRSAVVLYQSDEYFWEHVGNTAITAEEMAPYFALPLATFKCLICDQHFRFDELALHKKDQHWRAHSPEYDSTCWQNLRVPTRLYAEYMIAKLHQIDGNSISNDELVKLQASKSQCYDCKGCTLLEGRLASRRNDEAAIRYSYSEMVRICDASGMVTDIFGVGQS